MLDPVKLRFDIELEVVTGSRLNAHMEWHLCARELSSELIRLGVKTKYIKYTALPAPYVLSAP